MNICKLKRNIVLFIYGLEGLHLIYNSLCIFAHITSEKIENVNIWIAFCTT